MTYPQVRRPAAAVVWWWRGGGGCSDMGCFVSLKPVRKYTDGRWRFKIIWYDLMRQTNVFHSENGNSTVVEEA